MRSSLQTALPSPQRKNLARASLRGEAPSKFLGSVRQGPILERCFQLSQLTKDQAAREMDYADASTISKWLSDEVPFNFARLWSKPRLRAGLIAALAEDAQQQVDTSLVITIRRLA